MPGCTGSSTRNAREHSRYEREIGWLQNDPEYLAVIARDKLDLMKDGETILRVEPPKTSAPPEAPAAPTAPHHAAPLN